MKIPHSYQNEAVTAVARGWSDGWTRQVVLMPTGTGKTFIGALIIGSHDYSTGPVVFLTHRAELIKQTIAAIQDQFPTLRVGLVKATTHEVTDVDVMVASVQTLGRSALKRASIGKIGLLIIDECHHAAAKTYMDVVTDFGGFDGTRTVGLTATLVRNDKIGLGDVWQHVAFERSIEWAERNKHLVPHDEATIIVPTLDLTKVATVALRPEDDDSDDGTDYSERALGRALVNANAGPIMAREYLKRAGQRQGIVFTPTKAAAAHVCDAFNAAGIASALVTGETPEEERELIFKRIREHDLQVIVNVMVLTEGFDLPQLEIVLIARPTKSKSLKVQMIGRGKRLSKETGKKRCLVLYTAGKTRAVGTKRLVDLHTTDGRARPEPRKPSTAKATPPAPKRVVALTYETLIVGSTVTVTRVEGTLRTTLAPWSGRPGATQAMCVKAAALLIKRDRLQRMMALRKS